MEEAGKRLEPFIQVIQGSKETFFSEWTWYRGGRVPVHHEDSRRSEVRLFRKIDEERLIDKTNLSFVFHD